MLGVLPGIVGLIQATEVIKLIVGIGQPLFGRLIAYDALAMEFRELKVKREENCALCGNEPKITELVNYEEFCGVACST